MNEISVRKSTGKLKYNPDPEKVDGIHVTLLVDGRLPEDMLNKVKSLVLGLLGEGVKEDDMNALERRLRELNRNGREPLEFYLLPSKSSTVYKEDTGDRTLFNALKIKISHQYHISIGFFDMDIKDGIEFPQIIYKR